jgi:hypothetical protein
MTIPIPNPHIAVSMLAFFQGTQLNLFERFLTQAVAGIDSTSITSGMQNVAYVVLLVGFLWQVYQSALHGGDVRGLGTNLIKYIVTALVVMNYGTIFTTVNQGFVNAGNWISNASGSVNLFENWKTDISTQFSQIGFQNLWGLITGSVSGVIDGILILVAYILYPLVIAIFGFFYIFYGSVLYIFGPIVIALLPLGATNRIAKSYIENVFIWNSWPVLYGGFGALLSAVQMGQVGQMLSQNDFLGGLGNLEGSFLIGIASIIYSLAIAVIPFIAKRIVSGDVGATAVALVGAAATVVTAGIAAGEGAAAGIAAAGTSATHGAETGSSSQVLHSVELAGICAALTTAHVLTSWQWELEVLSQNLVYGGRCAKDFDALAEVSNGNRVGSFAIEFERTAKGSARYADLRKVLSADNSVDTILYLTPDPSILYLLAAELRAVDKRIGFALSRAFRSSLLSTNVLTNASANDVVTFREFLFG